MGLWGSFGSLVFRHFAQTATSEVYELLYNRYFGRGCLVGDKPFVIITVMIADRRRGTMHRSRDLSLGVAMLCVARLPPPDVTFVVDCVKQSNQ